MKPPFPEDADLIQLRHLLLYSALPLTGNRADAEDLVQLAFARALERTGGDENVDWGPWLRTVVRRLGIDLIRRHRRWQYAQLESAALEAPLPDAEEPEEPAWSAYTGRQVRAALEHCDPLYAQVFDLHYFRRQSYAEIAEQLGIPIGTVATRLHRARARVRCLLERLVPSPLATPAQPDEPAA